jgi:hypothetical protein
MMPAAAEGRAPADGHASKQQLLLLRLLLVLAVHGAAR